MEKMIDPGTQASMRANRSRDTAPELTLRKALWRAGLRGYRKHVASLPGKPDVCFIGRRLCVFVHGCFWHRCPECDARRNLRPTANRAYWDSKIARNVARDAETLAQLEAAGWRVAVVWECELKRDLKTVVQRVALLFDAAPK